MENNWVKAKCVDDDVCNQTVPKLTLNKVYEIRECEAYPELGNVKHYYVKGKEKSSIGTKAVYHFSHFDPIIPEQYADMTSEIAQQFKEHPDTVDQPVKVLETVN